MFEGTKAIGIEFNQNGVDKKVFAKRETILSAGAIGSPMILQYSGIGPAQLLKNYSIDIIQDAPLIGQNLQDHLQIRCAYKVKGVTTLNTQSSTLRGKFKIGLEYALKRTEPL